ncbi:DUF2860 domain-containing protein [Vibrio sp. 10N.261.55.A7]|uniref:DUF2860 domain-containing protein n=1 Tax=Vibrio sp. 10N.261.55.A7 TaxID=1880851 RepID=UPI000C860757|nr:DUF2860 domain-containing protein [Vibrio sp. 10N.261.55.A7]PMJ89919.1 hypothetical protein BCU12_13230 [Vibrio sp. 10N.261.55.A7]
MKKTTLSLSILTFFLSASTVAELAPESGFAGEISLNTGYMSKSSNFNTDDKDAISDLNSEGQSNGEMLVIPLGQINYTFGQQLDKQVYIGTAREDIAVGDFAFEIGYKQELQSGTVVDVSFLPTVVSGETWSDPYALNASREVTDETGNAYRLKLESIAGSNFTLDMAYATIDVKNETSGSGRNAAGQQKLQRDGDIVVVKGEYSYMLNQTSGIVPSLSYKVRSSDGEAMAYSAYGTDITYFKVLGRHQFALTAGYETRNYDGVNPIFSETRSDNELSLFAAYEYNDLMGWEDVAFISFAGYGNSASNIDFYNESEYLYSAGVNYKF